MNYVHSCLPGDIHSMAYREELIKQALVGYFASDIWKMSEYSYNYSHVIINGKFDFNIFKNEKIKNEIKYFIYIRLTTQQISVKTAWHSYSHAMRHLGNFIAIFYPNTSSILDVPYEVFLQEFEAYLSQLKLKKSGSGHSTRMSFFTMCYLFISDFYDLRPEIEKDRWDVRKLGIEFNRTNANYQLDFCKVPSAYRDLVKEYFNQRLVIQQSITWSTAKYSINALILFLGYIARTYPDWYNLNGLCRTDILGFFKFIRETPIGLGRTVGRNVGKPASADYILRCIHLLEVFLQYIQRHEFEESPKIHVKKLILPVDKPKQRQKKPEDIKYIPDHIWNQVVENIHHLPSEMVPIIILMEATGFRGCDVLLLKMNCLLEQSDGYWISGAQRKVNEDHHKVPISDEIASIVKTQIESIRENIHDNENPENYLFPILTGKKKGQPFLRSTVYYHLNKMAQNCSITDESGRIYKFKNHAFRHRYGITLINNGMNILHVQKLMAHLSPEMTLIYARIHDRTLRKEWERAKDLGAVRLDQNGNVIEADIAQQADENKLEIEWIRHNLDSIRLDHGFCIKSPKINCSFLTDSIEPPCIKNKCPSFHVDHTFLSYYEQQINKMESDIEIFNRTGRTRSIEIIQPKLSVYKEIAAGLMKSEGIFGLPKSNREYLELERNQVE